MCSRVFPWLSNFSSNFHKYRCFLPLWNATNINQTRNYSRRGLVRKPIKVIPAVPSETVDSGSGETVNVGFFRQFDRANEFKPELKSPPPGQDLHVNKLENVADHVDAQPRLRFEKVNAADKRVRRILTLMRSRKYREQTKKVLLEGRRLIIDAILAGAECHTIYFSRVESLEGIPWYETDAELLRIPYKEVKLWSDVVTPQGIMAVFSQPRFEDLPMMSEEQSIPLTVICDNIREPGNLGALLRSAVAAGSQQILVTKGCVDIWDLKVLRAGAGAHFRTQIHNNLPWDSVKNYLDDDVVVHVADCRTADAFERVEEDDCETESVVDPRTLDLNDVRTMNLLSKLPNEDLMNDMDVDKKLNCVPTKDFYNIDWTVKSAIVIGGETHGLSKQAVDLADETYGYKVHIPMAFGMDSLNAAMATSVVTFEAKRQYLNCKENNKNT
ncbi:rRNA methyltransferase 3A, mitochondrial-like [Saccoglossus kowalevskii]